MLSMPRGAQQGPRQGQRPATHRNLAGAVPVAGVVIASRPHPGIGTAVDPVEDRAWQATLRQSAEIVEITAISRTRGHAFR